MYPEEILDKIQEIEKGAGEIILERDSGVKNKKIKELKVKMYSFCI